MHLKICNSKQIIPKNTKYPRRHLTINSSRMYSQLRQFFQCIFEDILKENFATVFLRMDSVTCNNSVTAAFFFFQISCLKFLWGQIRWNQGAESVKYTSLTHDIDASERQECIAHIAHSGQGQFILQYSTIKLWNLNTVQCWTISVIGLEEQGWTYMVWISL